METLACEQPAACQFEREADDFFQPQSNANELLGVFKAIYDLSDDVSAIPKYLSGNSPAEVPVELLRLAMLMEMREDPPDGVRQSRSRYDGSGARNLMDLVLLTDTTGMLQGTETVTQGCRGGDAARDHAGSSAGFCSYRQSDRYRHHGTEGRAAVLRSVSTTIGLPVRNRAVRRRVAAATAQAQANAQAAAAGHQQMPPEAQVVRVEESLSGPRCRTPSTAGQYG